jgi:hypothetical protein
MVIPEQASRSKRASHATVRVGTRKRGKQLHASAGSMKNPRKPGGTVAITGYSEKSRPATSTTGLWLSSRTYRFSPLLRIPRAGHF